MIPTHTHKDGGLYMRIGPCSGKAESGEWLKGVIYRGQDGEDRWTSEERWADRFDALDTPVDFEEIKLFDGDGDEVAVFHFFTRDAGDVRHGLITAGPQPRNNMSVELLDNMKRILSAQAEMITKGLFIRDIDFPDLLGNVTQFHEKYGQSYYGKPRQLPRDLHDFRVGFHDEETTEYSDEYEALCDAITRQDRRDILNSLELQLDALVDAVWVILGTADLQFGRHAFFEAWRRVVTANMAKVKKEIGVDQGTEDSGREEKFDVVKPAGWVAPDHRDLVQDNAIFDEVFGLPSPEGGEAP